MSFEGKFGYEAAELAQYIDNLYSKLPGYGSEHPGDDVKMFLILKKCLNKEEITENDLQFAAEKMNNNWQDFALRREMCKLLLTNHTAYDYLKNVDAAPKAKLLASSYS